MAGAKGKFDDKELIERILTKNDQMAYAALMDKYKRAVYFTILKMVNNQDDADDLTMQAFTKAFNSLDKFDSTYAFSTWLFRIASNNTIDHIRKRRLQTTSLDKGMYDDDEGNSQSIGSNIIDDSLDPEEELVREQRNKIMGEVIDTMDVKYKELIQLYYFQEMKYEEIAQLLNIPLGTVKVRLKRAKDFLSRLLKGHDTHY